MDRSVRVTYRQSSDATPEGEARALAQVYRLALQLGEQEKKGASAAPPHDAKEPITGTRRGVPELTRD